MIKYKCMIFKSPEIIYQKELILIVVSVYTTINNKLIID